MLGSPDRPGGLRTSLAWPGAVSMDGKRRRMDNIFIERLWRSLKYEEVFLQSASARSNLFAWGVGSTSCKPSRSPITSRLRKPRFSWIVLLLTVV